MAKYKKHKQKGLKQEIDTTPRVVLSKEEYQTWTKLRGKGLKISQVQMRNYLLDVKKANAKLNKLKDNPNYFNNENIKLTENLLVAETQEELVRILNRPSEILNPRYEQIVTSDNIKRLQRNVDKIFGEGVINFGQLSPRQLRRFFEENEHLTYLIYYPEDDKAKKVVEMTGDDEGNNGVDAIKKNIDFWSKQ